ncbi:MAG: sugar ABC transporter permease, partial [Spirochaetales bacterium]|nr:sugar ABC transporter permease [Spirochaetales bacterium]
ALKGSFYKQRLNIPKFREPVFHGLGNFIELFQDLTFRQVLSNTLVYTALLVPACLVTALLMALLVNREERGIRFYRFALFHPTVIPMVCAATVWLFFLTPDYGLFNTLLARLGYGGPQNWTTHPDRALLSLMITAFWKNAGYYMLFYLAGIQNISPSLFEAAKLDGAGPLRILFSITLPLLKRSTLFITTIAFIGTFQSVDHVFILTGGGPSDKSTLLLYHLWQVRFENLNVGHASAITIVLVLFLLLFTLTNIAVSEKNEK